VIGCMISVLLKLIPMYFPDLKAVFDVLATWVVLGVVTALTLYISVQMFKGAAKEVRQKKAAMGR